MTSADVVVPTVGRGSLALLLASLDGPPDRLPRRVIVVDDRATRDAPLDTSAVSPELRERLDVVASNGGGPAIARNRGWQASQAEWVAFLDDDVIPCRGWLTELAADLDGLPSDVGASQGRLLVPMPAHRSPTDRERGERLATARCANIAFRTRALAQVGGFDEGSQRADRDDAGVAVRMRAAGFRIVDGNRQAVHPLWALTPRASADAADAASARWRAAMDDASGRLHHHVTGTAVAARALAASVAGRTAPAVDAMRAWLAGTGRDVLARVADGSHAAREQAIVAAARIGARSAVGWRRLRDQWHRLRDEARAARRRRATRPPRTPSTFETIPPRRAMLARAVSATRWEDLAGAPPIPDEIVELTDCIDPAP